VDTARRVSLLCVCVFDDRQLREVLLDSGALGAMHGGSIVAIHTTSSPKFMEQLADVAPTDVQVLDATFSGTATQVHEGGLTLMVGGDRAALESARPVLSAYGGNIVHVGKLGSGQRLKLLNNVLFASHVRLGAEAIRIAERAGIDRQMFVSTLMTCSGGSFALGVLGGDVPLHQRLTGLSRYLDKDVQLSRDAAEAAGIDLGLLGEVTRDYGTIPDSGADGAAT
jgi:3-hydroxyisobutyrate dehydrogenase-like beta-hydroxyacid dehydrogenase